MCKAEISVNRARLSSTQEMLHVAADAGAAPAAFRSTSEDGP